MLKSAVMSIANMLHYRRGLTRPQALKTAWRMAKQGEFYSKAVGVSFGLRQTALMRLKRWYRLEQISVRLVHEADNRYDRDAVAVQVSVNGGRAFTVGYLPRQAAQLWARVVDRQQVTAGSVQVTGGNGRHVGLNFRLQLVA